MSNRNQEFFNLAYTGLASQGWNRCGTDDGCDYFQPETGWHCAWGWVDRDLPADEGRFVRSLCRDGVGVAGTLTGEELAFATEMQVVHDARNKEPMQQRFIELAKKYNLTVPEVP